MIVCLLFDLIKLDVKIVWKEKHKRAFLKPKRGLKISVGIFRLDFSQPFIVETGA